MLECHRMGSSTWRCNWLWIWPKFRAPDAAPQNSPALHLLASAVGGARGALAPLALPDQGHQPGGAFPGRDHGCGANVYFVTQAADGGADLDVKDATGTAVVKEFSGSDSSISDLTPDGSKLFFDADLNKGEQLWVTNGTRAGTKLVKNAIGSGQFGNKVVVGSVLYFASQARQGNRATYQLFKSNGTAAGTVAVALPVSASKSGPFSGDLADYDGTLYFSAGVRLMKTNGVATKVVGTFGPPHYEPIEDGGIDDLTVAGGLLYFTFPDATEQGEYLYATNGTAGGTTLVHDFVNGNLPYKLLSNFTAVGSKLFFGADPVGEGPSLWESDGTAAGTTLVKTLGARRPQPAVRRRWLRRS